MDHDDRLGQVEGHDLQFEAPVVVADPDESGVVCAGGGDPGGLGVGDDVHGVGLADAVTPG